MSLKNRLRLSVLMFLIGVVITFSLLHVHSLAREKLQSVRDNANMVAQLAQIKVQERINQRTRELNPRPQTLQEFKEAWVQIVEEDETLSDSLARSFSQATAVSAVSLLDVSGQVLTSSEPNLVGTRSVGLPDFFEFANKNTVQRLLDIAQSKDDMAVRVALGPSGTAEPVIYLQVQISYPLLRALILPDLQNILVVTLIALVVSGFAAYLVAQWATKPLETIVQQIEAVAGGQAPASREFETKELMAVQTKLDLLGQRFRGAQESATTLRSNVEQMVERLEEAVLLFDRNGILILCGQPAARLFGRPVDTLLGRRLEDVFPGNTPHGQALQYAIDTNQSLRNFSFSIPDAVGHTWHVLMSAENLESFPDLERLGTLVTLRDVDSRREVESQLGVSTRLEAISKLMSGVAHEIKNPLNAMALHLEVLRGQVQDEKGMSSLNIIGREIFRLDRVVKTFLDFTRPVELRLREVDLQQLLGEVAMLVRPDAEQRQVQMEMKAAGGAAMILADPDLIKQALLNVVMNGVEAMSAGGKMTVSLERGENEFVVEIADTGPGIPPSVRDKVFQLYFTTKKNGSGLGLAMTFRAVQLHNGSIQFESEEGRGTVFRLRFPGLLNSGLRAERGATVHVR